MNDTVPLSELADVIRSKNAGPFVITFDVLFNHKDAYQHVRDNAGFSAAKMATLFGVLESEVVYCDFFDPAQAFKLSLLRHGDQGGIGERDTFGAQQHGPLLDLLVPAR